MGSPSGWWSKLFDDAVHRWTSPAPMMQVLSDIETRINRTWLRTVRRPPGLAVYTKRLTVQLRLAEVSVSPGPDRSCTATLRVPSKARRHLGVAVVAAIVATIGLLVSLAEMHRTPETAFTTAENMVIFGVLVTVAGLVAFGLGPLVRVGRADRLSATIDGSELLTYLPPAGWYVDPMSGDRRFWDGLVWTDRVAGRDAHPPPLTP